MYFIDFLRQCKGIEIKERNFFLKNKNIEIPKGVLVEITSSSTKGTIGEIIDFEPFIINSITNRISGYAGTLILKCQDRQKPVRIRTSYCLFLKNYTGPTKYVRTVKKKEKKEIPVVLNKYKQPLEKGKWCIGVRINKRLGIGRISRWTEFNVWAVWGDDLTDKSKEFRFNNNQDIFIMSSDDFELELTMARLKGWNGK